VFYDFGIKLKLIINGVKLMPKITFFIKGHFFKTLPPLLQNVRRTPYLLKKSSFINIIDKYRKILFNLIQTCIESKTPKSHDFLFWKFEKIIKKITLNFFKALLENTFRRFL
jgi:hypothetical protein